MFSNLYSNLIYCLLLLYSPKENNNQFDDNSADYHKNDLFIRNYKNSDSSDKCLDTNRIERFVLKSVQNLILKLKTISDNSTELEVNIHSRISVRHLNILRQYLPQNYDHLNCEQLEEFEDSINQFIESMVTISDNDSEETLKSFPLNYQILSSNLFKLFVYLLTFLVTIVSLRHLFEVLLRRQTLFHYKRLFCKKFLIVLLSISLIFISIVWKWRQKYLIELSRKQCYVLSAPEECLNRHSELTFFTWIRHYMYSYEQRRHDYYRAVTVDPFWEINPLTVISELMSELIFTPLKPLGEYSGLFMSSFFRHIPLYLVVPVFLFLSFCAVLLVLLIAVWLLMPNRYSIKVPFLMTIQFDRNHPQLLTDQSRAGGPIEPAPQQQAIVRKYQIKANVVHVYHTIGTNDSNSGHHFDGNRIKFDENLTFETIKPISIPYSEVD